MPHSYINVGLLNYNRFFKQLIVTYMFKHTLTVSCELINVTVPTSSIRDSNNNNNNNNNGKNK